MFTWKHFGLQLGLPEYYRNMYSGREIKTYEKYYESQDGKYHAYELGIVSPKLWISVKNNFNTYDWIHQAQNFTGYYELAAPVIRPECVDDILQILQHYYVGVSRELGYTHEVLFEKPTTFSLLKSGHGMDELEKITPNKIEYILNLYPKQVIKGSSSYGLDHSIKTLPSTMVLRVLPIPCMDVRPTLIERKIEFTDSTMQDESFGSIFRFDHLGDERFGGDLKGIQENLNEDDLTSKLIDIIRISERMKKHKTTSHEEIPKEKVGTKEDIIWMDNWELLQYHITTYFNNNVMGIPPSKHRQGARLKSIASRLLLSNKIRTDSGEITKFKDDEYNTLVHLMIPNQFKLNHQLLLERIATHTSFGWGTEEEMIESQTQRKRKDRVGFKEVKGIDPLIKWLKAMGKRFTPEGMERFGEYPTGVLLTGIPGCGKSMIAKAIASEWGLEFRRYMPDQLVGNLVGDNEQKMRDMLVELETLAPVVCFIDEAEKLLAQTRSGSFYRASDAGRDSAESILLQFMNDNNSGVFFVFTANDYEKLSSALVDRFDERWFIDLPSEEGRSQIIKSQLKSRRKVEQGINIAKLTKFSKGFSGRDLNFSITEAEMEAFIEDNRDLTELDLIKSFKKRKPTSLMHSDQIKKLKIAMNEGKLRKANTKPSDLPNSPNEKDSYIGWE